MKTENGNDFTYQLAHCLFLLSILAERPEHVLLNFYYAWVKFLLSVSLLLLLMSL